MATNSGIDYVNHSLGFWKGCTPVPGSPGCNNCYGRREMRRYGLDPFKVVCTSYNTWRQPLAKERITGQYKWKSGDMVFVCPWSDFFHKDADQWRADAWDLMRERPDLIWVIVTKRIENAACWIPINWASNNRFIIVTVENQKQADKRIPQLLKLRRLFNNLTLGVSLEPLLENIFIGIDCVQRADLGLDCVIVGCESGPKRRPCKIEWVRDILNQCKSANLPVFVKQLSINGKVNRNPEEWPEEFRIRQFPKGGDK